MNNIMENLINNKFYATKDEIENKLNLFFAFNILREEDYTTLIYLTKEKYKEISA